MPHSPSTYTKLTPRNRSLAGYTQLWLAHDHILLLTSTRIAEEYKRFAFSDIQSIVVTRQPSRILLQIVMIAAALAWTALWFTVDSSFAKWTFVVTGAFALLLLIVDIARGARCLCYLHTRVSGERLAPVSRMSHAHKFLALVRPMAEAVQGTLPPQTETLAPETPAPEPPPPALVSKPGYIPEILFATFLANAIIIWAYSRFPKAPELPGVLLNTLFAEVLLIAVALLRRAGRDSRVIIYVVVALSIVGVGFDLATIARSIFGWYMTVLDKAKAGDKSITLFSTIPLGNRRAAIAYAWRAVAGAFGLAAAFYERRKK
jgi:hypothetical protein